MANYSKRFHFTIMKSSYPKQKDVVLRLLTNPDVVSYFIVDDKVLNAKSHYHLYVLFSFPQSLSKLQAFFESSSVCSLQNETNTKSVKSYFLQHGVETTFKEVKVKRGEEWQKIHHHVNGK